MVGLAFHPQSANVLGIGLRVDSRPAMRSRDFISRIAAGVAGSSLILAASTAIAQHPAHDQEIHQRFYSTWKLPDNRRLPCCDDKDCSPAESKFESGHWMARKLGDDHWIKVPPEAVEHERTSPDGRSHLCSEFYMVRLYGLVDKVYCFIPGAGF
jgi:hypothetical protein